MSPKTRALIRALRLMGSLLDAREADYCFEGRFRFDLDGDWSLVLSADDAGRFRLDACLRSRVRASMWCRMEDEARFAALVASASREAAALAAA